MEVVGEAVVVRCCCCCCCCVRASRRRSVRWASDATVGEVAACDGEGGVGEGGSRC